MKAATDVCSLSVQPILALLGLPVSGNPSQYVMEKAFLHHALDWRYISLEVTPEGLGDAVRGFRALGFHGGHVAEPHKEAIRPLLDRVTPAAEAIGAVACITREGGELVGDNLDGAAVVECVRRKIDPRRKRVVVAGTGGMARAVAFAWAEEKPAELTILARSEAPGRALLERLAANWHVAANLALASGAYAAPAATDVFIDATSPDDDNPDDPRPLSLAEIPATAVVVDVSYTPPRAWLLRAAAERGCATISGVDVFVERLAASFRRWTGISPDRNVMREAAEEFLEV
jgi:shikimate dehydrogenase